jgi:ABC-type antimicrobial peptide transport system permease subunit
LPTDPNNLSAITSDTAFIDVVGVVREVKQSLTDDQAVGACFFPIAQNMPPARSPAIAFTYAIKSAGDPAALGGAVRAAFGAIDRESALYDVLTMDERVDRALVSRRSPMVLSVSFAAIALFLSAVGVYGVLAYVVAQRTREIAIRIALGSSRSTVFRLILREGLTLLGAGLALGFAATFALRQVLQSQLFGIAATDSAVLGLIAVLLVVVSIAACALPARRATRIDPLTALAG